MQEQKPIELASPRVRTSLRANDVWGSRVVSVGGGEPVRVQSMTNTDTEQALETALQVKELALAGSEMEIGRAHV